MQRGPKMTLKFCILHPQSNLDEELIKCLTEFIEFSLGTNIWQTLVGTTHWAQRSTLCLKKVPTFKLSLTLSNVNRFSKFCNIGKCTKFATKPIRHYPPHLRHVATLPWEINNANFLQIFSTYGRKCKQIAFLSPLPLLFIHRFRQFFSV